MRKKLVGKFSILFYADDTFDYKIQGDLNVVPASFAATSDILASMVRDKIIDEEKAFLLYDQYKKILQDILNGEFVLD